jgi:hypothetical protein
MAPRGTWAPFPTAHMTGVHFASGLRDGSPALDLQCPRCGRRPRNHPKGVVSECPANLALHDFACGDREACWPAPAGGETGSRCSLERIV